MTSCDVRDVVDGLLAACEKAPTGRQYILAGENLTYQQIWNLFAEVSGGSKPWFRAGPLMRFLGGHGGDLWGRMTGREPDLNSAGVQVTCQFHYYSSARAAAELGYHPRPFRQSVADAWAWFVEHGYVRGRKNDRNDEIPDARSRVNDRNPNSNVRFDPLVDPPFGFRRDRVALAVVEQAHARRAAVQLVNGQRGGDERPAAVAVRRVAAQQQKRSRRDQAQQLVMLVR